MVPATVPPVAIDVESDEYQLAPDPVQPPPIAVPTGIPVAPNAIQQRSRPPVEKPRKRSPLFILTLWIVFSVVAVALSIVMINPPIDGDPVEKAMVVTFCIVGMCVTGIVCLVLGQPVQPVKPRVQLTEAEVAIERAHRRQEEKQNRAAGVVGCFMGLALMVIGAVLTVVVSLVMEGFGAPGILFWGMILGGFILACKGLLEMLTGAKLGR